jgi:hypothetical protein
MDRPTVIPWPRSAPGATARHESRVPYAPAGQQPQGRRSFRGGSLGEATTFGERWPPAHRYNRRVAAARDEPGGGSLSGSPEGTRHEARGVGHEASSLSSRIGLEPDQSKATPSDSCGGVAQGFRSCGNAASPSCAPLRRLSLEQLRYLARRQDVRRAGLGQEPAPRLPKPQRAGGIDHRRRAGWRLTTVTGPPPSWWWARHRS